MHDRTKRDEDVAAELDYIRANIELMRHANDPLDTPLDVKVQAFTIERLKRYMADVRYTGSMDSLINDILKDWLYGEGE